MSEAAPPAQAVDAPGSAPSAAPSTLAKADPETLVLRGTPARAIRVKRSVVIAGAALVSVSVCATAWVALTPRAFDLVQRSQDRAEPARGPSDALAGLPDNYGDAPRLGPRLPGDLGRPILEHRRAMATESGPDDLTRTAQAAVAERERKSAELKAARESTLLFQSHDRGSPGTAPVTAVAETLASPAEPARIAIDPERDPAAQQRKADFVGARDRGSNVNPHVLSAPASSNMLLAGSVIPASLTTGLRSDLPGLVIAQVTERVFDSATGRILLIPQGTRLIGSYDSVVAFGQRRALVVWQRIILPDGSSLKIDNVPATDASGFAGLADKVDFHTWTLLKGVALSTLLGVGSNLTFSGESDLVQAMRESTQDSAARAGDQLTQRNLQVQPTITIRPGALVRLVVHRDLILAPWRE